jgi:hypothetical protein
VFGPILESSRLSLSLFLGPSMAVRSMMPRSVHEEANERGLYLAMTSSLVEGCGG